MLGKCLEAVWTAVLSLVYTPSPSNCIRIIKYKEVAAARS